MNKPKKEVKEEKEIKCPWCGRKKAVEKLPDDDDVYICNHCDKLFDLKKD